LKKVKEVQKKDTDFGTFIAMALNLHLLTGEPLELEDEVDSLVFGPIFIAMFSASIQMAPAELTSMMVLKK